MSAIAGTRRKAGELADGTIRVQIDIDPRFKADFHRLFPEIDMPCALAPLALDFEKSQPVSSPPIIPDTKPKKGPYGKEAQVLFQSGFFRSPAVWRAVGTDEELHDWTVARPCCVCGGKDYDETAPEGKCHPHHVRRAAECGTSYKAEYIFVPLCQEHHNQLHQHGESTLGGKEFFDKARVENVSEWCRQELKRQLLADSWTQISPQELAQWARDYKVEQYLPSGWA